jgi:hypothetical protein
VDRSSWRTAWEQRQEIAAHRWPSTAPTAPSSPWTGEEDLRSMGRWASVLNLGIVKRCETHPTGYPSDIQQNREPVLKQPSFESCGNVFSWVGMSWHENLTDQDLKHVIPCHTLFRTFSSATAPSSLNFVGQTIPPRHCLQWATNRNQSRPLSSVKACWDPNLIQKGCKMLRAYLASRHVQLPPNTWS